MQLDRDKVLFEIEKITNLLPSLTGHTRELARGDRDDLLNELTLITGSHWRSTGSRLTIVDTIGPSKWECITFRNADGSEATLHDVFNGSHILVMPDTCSFTADDIETNQGLVKLDEFGGSKFEWMPIFAHPHRKIIILRFSSDRVYTISNSYSIRAFHLSIGI